MPSDPLSRKWSQIMMGDLVQRTTIYVRLSTAFNGLPRACHAAFLPLLKLSVLLKARLALMIKVIAIHDPYFICQKARKS
jgi:hypothetical protein